MNRLTLILVIIMIIVGIYSLIEAWKEEIKMFIKKGYK